MTDRLKAVITQAEKLPQGDQDRLAEDMETLLDEIGWEKRFRDPQNQHMMQRMADAALKEHADGNTEEWS